MATKRWIERWLLERFGQRWVRAGERVGDRHRLYIIVPQQEKRPASDEQGSSDQSAESALKLGHPCWGSAGE